MYMCKCLMICLRKVILSDRQRQKCKEVYKQLNVTKHCIHMNHRWLTIVSS